MPTSTRARTQSTTRQGRRSISSLPRWQRLLIGLTLMVIGLAIVYLVATWLPVLLYLQVTSTMSSIGK